MLKRISLLALLWICFQSSVVESAAVPSRPPLYHLSGAAADTKRRRGTQQVLATHEVEQRKRIARSSTIKSGADDKVEDDNDSQGNNNENECRDGFRGGANSSRSRGGTRNMKAAEAAAAAATTATPVAPWLDGLKSGLASAMAAACVKTLLQPIDAIKTTQQFYHSSATRKSLTVIEACQEIWKLGGAGKFYAGLGVSVVGAMPGVSLYFGVYQYCKKKFRDTQWGQAYPRVAIALSAAIGNSVASFSRVPYEVMKQKLQTGVYDTTWEALVAAAKSPMASLFPKGGIAIQMIRDVPYAVATLLVYETLQGLFTGSTKERDFVLGGISGGFGSWITNPMDVIKTRLQTDSDMYGGSVIACTRVVWQEGGFSAFMRGAVPRLVHKVPANAFFFLFFEAFRRILHVEEAVQKQKEQDAKSKS